MESNSEPPYPVMKQSSSALGLDLVHFAGLEVNQYTVAADDKCHLTSLNNLDNYYFYTSKKKKQEKR